MNFQDKLVQLDACDEAREWVSDRTLEQAWAECPRADWMLWLATKVGTDKRIRVGAASAVARDVLPLFEAHRPGDTRVRDCLDACDRYAAGEDLDLEPHMRTAYASYAAASYAAYAGAAYAAYAAYAATAYAAYTAADAAYAAAAYAADANADAKRDAQARHAGIVRKMIPVEAIKELMK